MYGHHLCSLATPAGGPSSARCGQNICHVTKGCSESSVWHLLCFDIHRETVECHRSSPSRLGPTSEGPSLPRSHPNRRSRGPPSCAFVWRLPEWCRLFGRTADEKASVEARRDP